MASAFPTFLDKFMSIVQYLSNVFPQYDAISTLLNGEYQPRLRRHFELVYTDLLELLQAAAKVFMASNGSRYLETVPDSDSIQVGCLRQC